MIYSFQIAASGELVFGTDSVKTLAQYIFSHRFSRVSIIVSTTFSQSDYFSQIVESCRSSEFSVVIYPVTGEPTVTSVDALVEKIYDDESDMIVGIGGGSALDTAKAVSSLVYYAQVNQSTASVQRFLEGVGLLAAPEGRLPLVMIPTTAGTGSEATNNAVIANIGPEGFKKSLRHETYRPDLVIIDPQFSVTVPHATTAASGLDALTQLMEAYLSVKSNIFIDSLALPAITQIGKALPRLLNGELENLSLRADMAYSAYVSGIAISHVGLGYVHGLAGPLGGLHGAPHGVLCGSLIGPIHRAMVDQAELGEDSTEFVRKMNCIAEAWGVHGPAGVVNHIEQVVSSAKFPTLRRYGFTVEELYKVAKTNPRRNSPIALSVETISSILTSLY